MKIKLNFLDKYYPFYEWLNTDNIKEYDNYNFYVTSTKKLNELINHQIDFKLNKIAIISDSYSMVAIYKNKKSSLLYEDEEKLLRNIQQAKKLDVEYTVLEQEKIDQYLRYERYIQKELNAEIKELKKENNEDKIKYIYNEWFNKNSNDITRILKSMQRKINSNIDEKDIQIFKMVKNGYK